MLAASVPRWWCMLTRKRPRPSRRKLKSTERFFCSSSSCGGASSGSTRLRTSSASSGGPEPGASAPLTRSTAGAPAINKTSEAPRAAAKRAACRAKRSCPAGARPACCRARPGSIRRRFWKARYRIRSYCGADALVRPQAAGLASAKRPLPSLRDGRTKGVRPTKRQAKTCPTQSIVRYHPFIEAADFFRHP
jgi:hypothetical protein